MRDAAGDSGEFYTPRARGPLHGRGDRPPAGRDRARPRLRHRRLPGRGLPAPGSSSARPSRTARRLQTRSILGGEAKPLPYLLCQMNLLLHGLESPQIDPGNSLRFPLREIGDKDRVDVILTNPPFGGEEERGIHGNFPEDKQTAETALLFLQLIMRKLRRQPQAGPRRAWSCPTARSSATASAPASRRSCSRSSTCTPSCACPTASSRPTPASRPTCSSSTAPGRRRTSGTTSCRCPKGRKNYTKTQPLQFEEFADCLAWWQQPQGERARVAGARPPTCSSTTPRATCFRPTWTSRTRMPQQDLEHLPPEQLVEDILGKEQRIAEIMGEIKQVLAEAHR